MRIMKYIMLFFTILLSSFTYSDSDENSLEKSEIGMEMDNPMIWIGDWIPSDNLSSDYGRGRFFYRFSRSEYPIDRYGNYKHEITFISDSFHPHYMYQDLDGDGFLDAKRCATKIDNMSLYVNGDKYINVLTGTSDFWILFHGNFDTGYGEVRVQFLHRDINPDIIIQWSTPKPF